MEAISAAEAAESSDVRGSTLLTILGRRPSSLEESVLGWMELSLSEGKQMCLLLSRDENTVAENLTRGLHGDGQPKENGKILLEHFTLHVLVVVVAG